MKVNQQVYYYDRGNGPYAAVITEIVSDDLVNVMVFPPPRVGTVPYAAGCLIAQSTFNDMPLNTCWIVPMDAPASPLDAANENPRALVRYAQSLENQIVTLQRTLNEIKDLVT